MTDAANGSGFNSGNPEGTPTPAPEGSGGDGGSDFLSVLSEGNRELATAKGWTGPESFDAVLTGYSALEKQQGNSVALLGEEATPEERAAFFEKVSDGWTPKEASGYEYRMPENLPEDFAYSQEFVTEASQWFHEAKLNPQQAQFLHDKWVGSLAGSHALAGEAAGEAAKALEASHAEAHQALEKAWGPSGSEGYQTKQSQAVNAAEKLGLMGDLVEMGYITEDDSGARTVDAKGAAFVQKLVAVNAAMFSEDGLGGGSATADNPWAADTNNLSKQNAIYTQDPQKAKALITAAGLNPAKWGL